MWMKQAGADRLNGPAWCGHDCRWGRQSTVLRPRAGLRFGVFVLVGLAAASCCGEAGDAEDCGGGWCGDGVDEGVADIGAGEV